MLSLTESKREFLLCLCKISEAKENVIYVINFTQFISANDIENSIKASLVIYNSVKLSTLYNVAGLLDFVVHSSTYTYFSTSCALPGSNS